ncbi:oligosaccharide repeat unit polymerase [Shewanella algae]|uniref:oligosaccharide repeat unit polymerase n=1 Tax=Shewanella algae TaxID=38313 RepID=UPI001655C35E|nr:oligosaccharide repeat unit polymerase [Shewanella algae]MBC8796427.1 oligosaccharide repeat unit polymerase [Shewanella algae]
MLLAIYPIVALGIFRFKDNTLRFDFVSITFILFYIWCLLSITINFIFSNRYGYSLSNLFIALFFYCVLPLILLLVAIACPKHYERVIDRVVIPVGCFVLLTTITTSVVYLISPDAVIDFFVGLMKEDLIVNPIQSTSSEIQLRFSGVFYSSFTYALFCNFCFFYVIYNGLYSKWTKFWLCFGFFILIYLSLNRNGYIVFLFMVVFYFARGMINYRSNRNFTIIIGFVFAWLAFSIPVLLLVVDTSGGFVSVDSLYFKISTLFSRVNAWSVYFNNVSWLDVILGSGFVQGLGATDFFLDNSYYHVIATGGLALFGLLIFIIVSTSMLIISSKYSKPDQFVFSYSLFAAGLLSMFINNSLFEPIFLLLYVFYPISLALGNREFKGINEI